MKLLVALPVRTQKLSEIETKFRNIVSDKGTRIFNHQTSYRVKSYNYKFLKLIWKEELKWKEEITWDIYNLSWQL